MNVLLRNTLVMATVAIATQATAQVTFFEREDFAGRSFSTGKLIDNFERHGFNDRASSVTVQRDLWEVCDDARFRGRCVVLRPGHYPSLAALGLNNRISSVRMVSGNARIDDHRYAPVPVQDYRRSDNERLYEAEVTSVRAVLGQVQSERRCWVEREQVSRERGSANVPAGIAGALIGGILGHQIGGGSGKDIATAGGAVAGAVVGANIGRNGGQQGYSQDVQRCADVPSQANPDYWDVTYNFRGRDHRVQMTAPPGRTVTVNKRGEPRLP